MSIYLDFIGIFLENNKEVIDSHRKHDGTVSFQKNMESTQNQCCVADPDPVGSDRFWSPRSESGFGREKNGPGSRSLVLNQTPVHLFFLS